MSDKSAKEVALERAVAMLKASGSTFAIITQSGERIIHGDIEIVDKREKKRHPKTSRPIGALVSHYRPFLKTMNPGDCVEVPFGQFAARELRSAMTAWMSVNWGSKSYICVQKDAGFEVLRVY